MTFFPALAISKSRKVGGKIYFGKESKNVVFRRFGVCKDVEQDYS